MKNMDISDRIRMTMNQLGMTQKQFARAIGITQPAVSNYLKGRIPPGPVLLQIAHIGSVSLEWLLTGEEENKPHVSENKSSYNTGELLADRINQLPPSLQNTLAILVDEMCRLYLKDHR